MPDPDDFYDNLAEDYHLVYADWRRSVRTQGDVLDRFVRSALGDGPATILDCSCGIGTQAIGLALHDHTVTATDLSAQSVTRARREAASFGVDITFDMVDMREVADHLPGTFDIVLSCDNSLPHLQADADILTALENMRRKLAPSGLLIVGIRDYDDLVLTRSEVTPPRVSRNDGITAIVFQHWNWADDGRTYDLTLFVIKGDGGGWRMTTHRTRYRALLRDELDGLLSQAGFRDAQWHFPNATGHHQPLLTARASSSSR